MGTRAVALAALVVSFAVTCRAERPSEGVYLLPKDAGVYVGADYYPEHWPRERWETELKMMNDAHIRPIARPTAGVEVGMRSSAERKPLFLINYTDKEKSVEVPKDNRELLTDKPPEASFK